MLDTKNKRWIDISVGIKSNMPHWPGDSPAIVKRIKSMDKGDKCNLSDISMGAHTATHMDAPLHFVKNGESIDNMPPEATIGITRVIEIKDPKAITPQELVKHRIRAQERILFKTKNSTRCWKTNKFIKDAVYISQEAAEYLAQKKVQTIGIDYLSVGSFKGGGSQIHKALLKAGIWLIEGLNLSKVKPGRYEMICLPLKIIGAEGAPARAILRAKI